MSDFSISNTLTFEVPNDHPFYADAGVVDFFIDDSLSFDVPKGNKLYADTDAMIIVHPSSVSRFTKTRVSPNMTRQRHVVG